MDIQAEQALHLLEYEIISCESAVYDLINDNFAAKRNYDDVDFDIYTFKDDSQLTVNFTRKTLKAN